MKKIKIKITLSLLVGLLLCSTSFSQVIRLSHIEIGNDAEVGLMPMLGYPDAKLVNIYTTPLFSIVDQNGNPYEYRFATDGDSVGYATFWIATFYDSATGKIFSFSLWRNEVGGGGALQWDAPMTSVFSNMTFSPYKSLVTNTKNFEKFIKKMTNLQEKMLASQAGISYVLGAGLPESCVINNEPINFNENEMIYYSQIAMSDNSVDMCYQYFDSIDINCNYNSVYEFPILSSISISPNPTSNYLNVELAETHSKITAEVLDLSGKVLFETNFENAQNFRIDFPFVLSNGTYMLHLNADGRRSYTNFIIAK